MDGANTILHITHDLALSQDQDNGTRQNKAKKRDKGDEKLQELPRKDTVKEFRAYIVSQDCIDKHTTTPIALLSIYRSTSPSTTSILPIIATTSLILYPRNNSGSTC